MDKQTPAIADIVTAVAAEWDLPELELTGNAVSETAKEARGAAIYLGTVLTDQPISQLAAVIGPMTPESARYYQRATAVRYEADLAFARRVNRAAKAITADKRPPATTPSLQFSQAETIAIMQAIAKAVEPALAVMAERAEQRRSASVAVEAAVKRMTAQAAKQAENHARFARHVSASLKVGEPLAQAVSQVAAAWAAHDRDKFSRGEKAARRALDQALVTLVSIYHSTIDNRRAA